MSHTPGTQVVYSRARCRRYVGADAVDAAESEGLSATTTPKEKALLVRRWQSVQWHVYTNCGASLIS